MHDEFLPLARRASAPACTLALIDERGLKVQRIAERLRVIEKRLPSVAPKPAAG